ncbi:hypothetical protein BHF71_03935 [Vulcanibacillus modesticaldus]|uniref:Heptaprenyl diphosphate synthase n=1 Tax=Vulcanibacillus modesticaldus TaxID=337097 RepID=A0A1D2YSN6_9BACI|nr:heptaprenyl diphosphate synthase component 1 [Vulcanibacillus modesticaldus]OEF97293.1 hypothetical protein BHF71_03935 [Vulcanibacillus modesticaldus]
MRKTHSSFNLEMEEIISEIANLSKNIYIEKYVEIPEVSVVRIQLLNLFLYHASIPHATRKNYCITSGLVQMGLDLHESITNQKEFNEKWIRNRQLSILAGDYYSSKYYYILSKANLIDGVKKLAYGISNINIAKMKLYNLNNGKGFNSIDQILELVKVRETSLYTQFLDEIQSVKLRSFWQYVIENTILLSYILDELQIQQVSKNHLSYQIVNFYTNRDEKRDILELDNLTEFNVKLHNLYHKYNIRKKIEELIQKLYDGLKIKIEELDDLVIKSELRYILNRYSNSFQLVNFVKEF